MGQKTDDSKVGEYEANNESCAHNPEKQPSNLVAAKSMALPDSQKENGLADGASKICGSKRTTPDCPISSLQTQCPTSNSGNGHLVYVRRRPDAELGKSTAPGDQRDQQKRFDEKDEKVQQDVQMKESSNCVSEVLEIPKASLAFYLPTKHSTDSSIEKCENISSSNLSNLHTTSVNHLLDTPKRVKLKQWEERYCRLQNLLNSLDQSKQEDYIQTLRSLSSVELSKHAVELEKRSIQLALEEAKELRWIKVFDILGKDWNSGAC